jgi:hypothetical protein
MATVFQMNCFLYLHLNAWTIPKSKGCSWLVQLASEKNNLYVPDRGYVLQASGTLISEKWDFFIYSTHVPV